MHKTIEFKANKQNKRLQNNKGFVTISAVLLLAAIATTFAVTLALNSVNQIQTAVGLKESFENLNLIEGCIEDALLYLNENDSLPSTITLPEATCTVTLNSNVGDDWDFTVSLNNQYYKQINVDVTRNAGITINNWSE